MDCLQILEERIYLRLVTWTFVAAFALHFAFGKLGYPGRGLLRETFMTEAALLILTVLVWKAFQKWKSPQRRILYELASFYSDRTGRIVIFVLAAVFVISFSGLLTARAPQKPVEPDLFESFRVIRTWLLVGFGFVYLVVVFYIQGIDFFDLSLKNSFIRKELKNAEREA